MVATSAWRAAMTHESGKTRFRSFAPTMYTPGRAATATNVRPTWIEAMTAKATTKLSSDIPIRGAKAATIWTERMSELAREMIWPDCTRS